MEVVAGSGPQEISVPKVADVPFWNFSLSNPAGRILSESKMGGYLCKPRMKIFLILELPGPNFFCAIAAMKAVIAILPFATLIRGFCGSGPGS